MCGIAGILSLNSGKLPALEHCLHVMNDLQKHRGPDGQKLWYNKEETIGFAHQRLSINDLSTGDQAMTDDYGNTICYNGEVYNYLEVKKELNGDPFKTSSDTE